MLRAIKFNYQSRLVTIKIRYIIIDDFLPQKTHRIRTQKIIPQMPLFFCQIPSQYTCILR